MKLSTRMRYGTRALCELAGARPGRRLSVGQIAARQGLSPKYLEQILRPLRRAGLVAGTTGSHGGYTLARAPERIRLREVYEALEGRADLVACQRPGKRCGRLSRCPSRQLWDALADAMRRVLDRTTLAGLQAGRMGRSK